LGDEREGQSCSVDIMSFFDNKEVHRDYSDGMRWGDPKTLDSCTIFLSRYPSRRDILVTG
jgi:hypothetical protein